MPHGLIRMLKQLQSYYGAPFPIRKEQELGESVPGKKSVRITVLNGQWTILFTYCTPHRPNQVVRTTFCAKAGHIRLFL